MYMKLHFCNDWFETRSSSQTHCDNSCDFFILLNDTIWKNWSIYKYRIIQKMFCVNILGHSIPDLSINIFGSIPAFHWSPLGFAKNGQMADLSIVIYGSVRLKKHSKYGASFGENQKIYYKPPFLRFLSRNVNKAKES